MYHIEQLQAIFYILGIVTGLYFLSKLIGDIFPASRIVGYRLRRGRNIIADVESDEYAFRDYQWVKKFQMHRATDIQELLRTVSENYFKPVISIMDVQFLEFQSEFACIVRYSEKEYYDAE